MKVKKLLRLNYIMEKERLNKNFLHEFKEYDFSRIDESKIFLVGSIKFRDYFVKIESILQILYDKLVTICSIDGLLNKEKFASKEWDILQNEYIREFIDYLKESIKQLLEKLNNE